MISNLMLAAFGIGIFFGLLVSYSALSGLRLILQPISKPAANDLPLVAYRPEVEKVRPFLL